VDADESQRWCLICDADLNPHNKTEEHIIPDALGGRLKTTQATCRKCNSTTGHTIDARFSRKLAPIATMLDVKRESRRRDLVFEHVDTGRKIKIPPGESPQFKNTYSSVKKGGKTIRLGGHFSPRPGEAIDAQTILARIRSEHPNLPPGELDFTLSPEKPQVKFDTPNYTNLDDLRAVAKMMLTYVRKVGLSIARDCQMLRFLRGELQTTPFMMGPPVDVVQFDDSQDHDCRHTLSLFNWQGTGYVCVYIDLFSFIDYVGIVKVAEQPSIDPSAYQYDLILSEVVEKDFRWLVNEREVRDWMHSGAVSYTRVQERWKGSQYWLAHQPEIWARRAMALGKRVFLEALARGESDASAIAIAESAMKESVAAYGLTGEVKFSKR
jgi:hypothetical protein